MVLNFVLGNSDHSNPDLELAFYLVGYRIKCVSDSNFIQDKQDTWVFIVSGKFKRLNN